MFTIQKGVVYPILLNTPTLMDQRYQVRAQLANLLTVLLYV